MVPDSSVEFLVGRIATLIESWGLRDNQERAAISLAKQEIYQVFSRDYGGLWIDEELNSVIQDTLKAIREEDKKREAGTPQLVGDYELTFIPKV